MVKQIRKIGGIALIVAGLVAIPVPILPGVPFIAAGAALLGSDHPVVRAFRKWFEEKGMSKGAKTNNELSSV